MSDSAQTQHALARRQMVDSQLRPNEVNDERILAAVEAVAREDFVPKSLRSVAYVDEDIEIAPGRFVLEPRVFARLLLAADVTSHDVVLDIGCGLGYSSAVLAHLADSVVALEGDAAMVSKAEEKLGAAGIHNVAVMEGDMASGVAGQGPFDVIVLEGAADHVPQAILDQLAEGGRLVCVLLRDGVGRAHIITKTNGLAGGRDLFDAQVPVLPGFIEHKAFVF